MYTAKLIKRDIDQGRYKWTVDFTDGTKTWTEFFYDSKYEQVQSRVANKLKELNEVDTFTEGQDIDATIPTVTPPTQAELDRATWIADWRKLEVANKLVAAGVISDTLPAYVTFKNKVAADFKVSYINYLF